MERISLERRSEASSSLRQKFPQVSHDRPLLMTNASAADTLGINSTVQTRKLNQANGLTHCSVPMMLHWPVKVLVAQLTRQVSPRAAPVS